MLYNVVVNDWGETTYVPTALGNGLLAAAIAVLLVAAVALARLQAKREKKTDAKSERPENSRYGSGKLTVRQLVFCAMAVALATVL